MPDSRNTAKLDALLEERKQVKYEMVRLENNMFKLESAYQDLVYGAPITRSIEYYLNNKIEKKKVPIQDSLRIFATDFPRPKHRSI